MLLAQLDTKYSFCYPRWSMCRGNAAHCCKKCKDSLQELFSGGDRPVISRGKQRTLCTEDLVLKDCGIDKADTF